MLTMAFGVAGRSPCGERGLKLDEIKTILLEEKSLPVRGAWIEIIHTSVPALTASVAPRAGSVD